MLAGTPALAAGKVEDDCVAIGLEPGAALKIAGKDVEIPKDGMPLSPCSSVRFLKPVVKLNYLYDKALHQSRSYFSVAADAGVAVSERIKIAGSIIEIMKIPRGASPVPAAQTVRTGLMSFKKVNGVTFALLADPTGERAKRLDSMNQLLLIDAKNQAKPERLEGTSCKVTLKWEIDCSSRTDPSPQMERFRNQAVAFVAPQKQFEIGREYTIGVDSNDSLPVKVVSSNYLANYYAVLARLEALSVKGDPDPARLDVLLTQLSFAMLADDEGSVQNIRREIKERFPSLVE